MSREELVAADDGEIAVCRIEELAGSISVDLCNLHEKNGPCPYLWTSPFALTAASSSAASQRVKSINFPSSVSVSLDSETLSLFAGVLVRAISKKLANYASSRGGN
jgi:hypothetical protein